jgi:hypothetical protein
MIMDSPLSASPLSSHPSANGNHSSSERSLISMLFPPVGVTGIALLSIVLPLVLLTLESFLLPWLEASQILNFGQATSNSLTLPWQFYLKAAIFTVLGGGLTIYLLMQINMAYLENWTKRFGRPDPLHVDYMPSSYYSTQASLQWGWHRFMVIVVPPLVLVGLSLGLAWLGLFTMNTVMDLSTLALPSAITIFMFIGLMLGLITVMSCGNGLWLLLTTTFGDIAAILEPDLPPQAIFDRVRRINKQSPLIWLLYPLVAIIWLLSLAYVIWLLFSFDIQHIVTFTFPWIEVIGIQTGLTAGYLILNFLTLYTYHDALTRYYQSLPDAFRERFAIPD